MTKLFEKYNIKCIFVLYGIFNFFKLTCMFYRFLFSIGRLVFSSWCIYSINIRINKYRMVMIWRNFVASNRVTYLRRRFRSFTTGWSVHRTRATGFCKGTTSWKFLPQPNISELKVRLVKKLSIASINFKIIIALWYKPQKYSDN